MAATVPERHASWAGLALAPTSWYAMHVAVSSLTPAECGGWPATLLVAALAAAAIDDGRAARALENLARITSTPLETEEDA